MSRFRDEERLRVALALLPDRERRAVELRFFGKASVSDVAREFNLTYRQTRLLLSRAARTLREVLT